MGKQLTEAVHASFHVGDGVHFTRLEGGRVELSLPTEPGDLVTFLIGPSTWCSLVAAVSGGWPISDAYRMAVNLHDGPELDL